MLQPQSLSTTITKHIESSYLLYLPPDYEAFDTPWPLVLFLHGIGERGSDLNMVKAHGPAQLIEQGQNFPAVIVCPQCPDDEFWSPDVLNALLDSIIAKYNIDENRVYLTGLSMGGYGTWQLGGTYPERFAALAPICGGGMKILTRQMTDLPIWAFHGGADDVVLPEESKLMVDSINQRGGHAKLTIYPGVGHDSWTQTYQNPKFWEWLFQQKKP